MGHWNFDTSLQPSTELVETARKSLSQVMGNSKLGFKDLNHIRQASEACANHSEHLKDYDKIVVIGVGGSSLGTKAVAQALWPRDFHKRLIFLDNVDAHSIDTFIDQIDEPGKLAWILCSKSGSTIEVLSLYEYCFSVLKSKFNESIADNTWVVTEDKKSPLAQFAATQGVPKIDFPMDVGGRFSAFTAIGQLPLQIFGFSGSEVTEGFAQALADEDTIVKMAACLYPCVSGDTHSLYSFQYSDRLRQWSFWLQQLWSESLSKKTDRSGRPAPHVSPLLPCRGVSDQHSVLQQIIEGHESKFVCFHRVRSSEQSHSTIDKALFPGSLMQGKSIGDLMGVEMEATEQAVREANVPTLQLVADELSQASMANLMGLWMLVVGTLGEMIDINAFDQPGVESGKVIARRVLQKPD